MAMYLHKGLCYSAPSQIYSAVAADCPPVNFLGFPTTCRPTADGVEVSQHVSSSGAKMTIFIKPELIPCVPEIADAVELGGLVVLALASAFALKVLWRAF